ncbi:MAG: helix-turn-helix transcriptional regulator [Lachnospiraceae bacterium]|nr:helix-turn-helix transcriptional regulator [Lachnospiraceae bacterium]
MDNQKMGLFIVELRKAKQMTQKELAAKLNVTDKAVSKWERGVSCPDITLLPELAAVLGITVEELLNGEKSKLNMENDTVNIDNAIQYADKSAKNRMKSWQNLFAILFSAVLLLGIIVCSICDLAITERLSWSLFPTSAIIYAWFVLFPMIKWDRKGIAWSLTAVSLFTIPFLYVLSILVEGVDLFMYVGGGVAPIVILYLWSVFALFRKLKGRKWLAGALSLLLTIPMCILINLLLYKILNIPVFDLWDMLDFAAVIICAIVLLIIDFKAGKHRID